MKDLADLALLLELQGLPAPVQVAQAVEATFVKRHTHPLPATLLRPPASWGAPYAALARACGLQAATSEASYELLAAYWARFRLRSRQGRLPPGRQCDEGHSDIS